MSMNTKRIKSITRNKAAAEINIASMLLSADSKEIECTLSGIKDTLSASDFSPSDDFNKFMGIMWKFVKYKKTLLDDFNEKRNSLLISEIKDTYCSINPSFSEQNHFIDWLDKVTEKLLYSDLLFIKDDGEMDISELIYYYYWNCFKDKVESLDSQEISYYEKLSIKAPMIIDNSEDKDIVPLSHVTESLSEKSIYTFGLASLDEIIHLQPTNLFFIGARPSVGKSALILNACLKNSLRGIKCLYASLEMTTAQTRTRIDHWIDGEEQYMAIDVEMINENLYLLDAREMNGDYIFSKLEKFANKYPGCMICLDYIGLVRYNNMDEWGSLRKASMMAKSTALKTRCVFLAAAMASRDSELSGFSMSSLYGASTLEADSDGIIGLEPSKSGGREIERLTAKIVKNRDGEKDKDVPIDFDKIHMHFEDVN